VTFESQSEERVARVLEQLGVEYTRGKAIGGLRPDFIVQGPKGKTAIVEVKGWDSTGGNTARAVHQVEQYRQATGADLALIVLPELKRNFADKGVVNEVGLLAVLQDWLSKEWIRYRRVAGTKPSKREEQKTDRLVFAAMPFDRKYDDTFFVAMRYAAKRVNAVCERIDRTEFSGDIVEEIKRLIRASVAVIVDLSESKENVLYEAGYAHALEKPVVHICSTDLSRLPFDVRNWNTIAYDLGGTMSLRKRLATRLSSVL
jgi:nucleoside 2-deoxyribosyltransferase